MKNFLCYAILFCFSFVAFSQTDTTTNATNQGWSFDVAPYIWLAGSKGDISFREQSIPVSAKFKDVFKDLSGAFLMHAELRKDKWFVMGDIVNLTITKDGRIEALGVDTQLEIKETVAELALGYNIVNLSDSWLFIDGFAGLRYFGIDTNIDVSSQEVLDRTINTNDPFLGVRFRTVSEKWINSARFDVGGFGIGSKISWKLNMMVGYQFSKLLALHAGFQGYGIDYEKDEFGLDITSTGFLLGLNFRF